MVKGANIPRELRTCLLTTGLDGWGSRQRPLHRAGASFLLFSWARDTPYAGVVCLCPGPCCWQVQPFALVPWPQA